MDPSDLHASRAAGRCAPSDRPVRHAEPIRSVLAAALGLHRVQSDKIGEDVRRSPLQFIRPREPKPEWLKVRAPGSENYLRLKGIMKELKLNTVCEDARCPNIGECWHHGTATFMILGDVCTRACAYCAVAHGRPTELDRRSRRGSPTRSNAWAAVHAVITSVDRDDLADGGASIFAETIRETRARMPSCRIEVLIPDFQGDRVVAAHRARRRPRRAQPQHRDRAAALSMARSGGRYRARWSCSTVAPATAGIPTKTGIMVGLGEDRDEIVTVFDDLRARRRLDSDHRAIPRSR